MNIISLWISWFYFDMSRNYFSAFKNFLKFGLNFFSTPLLIKSFFSPWRRFKSEYPKSFDIVKTFEVLFFNLFSRFFGMIFRIIFILIGISFEILIFTFGIIFYICWVFLPVLLLTGIFYGLRFLMLWILI